MRRITVCGDIHLRRRGSFTAFLDDLASQVPRHLVIWATCLIIGWIVRHSFCCMVLFKRLRTLRSVGWTVHCVLGNRELAAGPISSSLPGRVYLRQLDMNSRKGRLRIVHGDRLVRDPGYRFMAAVLSSWWFRTRPVHHCRYSRASPAGCVGVVRQKIVVLRVRATLAARSTAG